MVGVIGSVEGGVAPVGDWSLSVVVAAAAAGVVGAEAATAVSGSWLLFVVLLDVDQVGTNSMAFTFSVENLALNCDSWAIFLFFFDLLYWNETKDF